MTEPAATSPLPDGTYDVFVVDAATTDPAVGSVRLDVTVVSGEHKGEVVTLETDGVTGSELDLLGMPATLTVIEGMPSVSVDS